MSTGYEWSNPAAEATWAADGRTLLDVVRDELGPEYDVEYFDRS